MASSDEKRLIGSRQVTDAYLPALAVAHGGVFVTLDTRIESRVVAGASSRHIVVP